MQVSLTFAAFLGGFLLIAAVWSIALDLDRIRRWLERR